MKFDVTNKTAQNGKNYISYRKIVHEKSIFVFR